MNEAFRIFSYQKRRIAVLCIPLILWVLFFYQKAGGNFSSLITDAAQYRAELAAFRGSTTDKIIEELSQQQELTSAEWKILQQAEHLRDYPEYLTRVQKQASDLQKAGIFQMDSQSFAYHNILKTAEDFKLCRADHLRLGNDRAMEFWLAFSPADWGYLASVILLIMSFMEERKKGLSAIIRACPGGRARLQVSRLWVLLGYCAAMTVLIYYVPLGISFHLDGGLQDLGRPIQSMAAFQKCTTPLSISGFLIQFFFVKLLCGFLLGILIWFLLSFLQQLQLCWLITVAGLTAEYLLYRFVSPQSFFALFGSINVFSYVFPIRLYTEYRNLNLLSYPIAERSLLIGLALIGAAILSFLTVLILSKRYPFGNRDLIGHWLLRWNQLGDWLRRPLGLYGMEWYKLIFLSTGGIFLLLGLWLSAQVFCDSGAYNKLEDAIYRQYVAEIQGPVSEETFAYLESARTSLEESQIDSGKYALALDRLEERLSQLQNGDWLVDDTGFLNVYGPEAWRLQRRNGLLALTLLAFCLAPLFSAEQNGDVKKVIRSTPGGREKLFWVKYAVAGSMTLIVWALFFGREWQKASAYLGSFLLSAPCGSLPMLERFSMTVRDFLGLLYLSKALLLMIPMHLCLALSIRSRSFERAVLMESAVLLIPAAAYHFGADAMGIFTPLSFLADENVLLSGGSILPIVLWMALSLLALASAKRCWCKV